MESVYSKEPSARIKETTQLKNAYGTSSNSLQHYSEIIRCNNHNNEDMCKLIILNAVFYIF